MKLLLGTFRGSEEDTLCILFASVHALYSLLSQERGESEHNIIILIMTQTISLLFAHSLSQSVFYGHQRCISSKRVEEHCSHFLVMNWLFKTC